MPDCRAVSPHRPIVSGPSWLCVLLTTTWSNPGRAAFTRWVAVRNSPTRSTDTSATLRLPSLSTTARANSGSATPVALRPLPNPATHTGFSFGPTLGVMSTDASPTSSAGFGASSGKPDARARVNAPRPRSRVGLPGSAAKTQPTTAIAPSNRLMSGPSRDTMSHRGSPYPATARNESAFRPYCLGVFPSQPQEAAHARTARPDRSGNRLLPRGPADAARGAAADRP